MINNVVLVGRLTKDPELTYTPSGVAKARFTMAVSRPFASNSGERESDFIQCIAWRKQAENLANFMKKGSLVGITGRIQTGSFEGQDGKRVYTTDVVAEAVQFLEGKGGNNAGTGTAPQNNTPQNNAPQGNTQPQTRIDEDPFAGSRGPIEVSEDDLPF